MKKNKLGIRIEIDVDRPYDLGHTISLHSDLEKNIHYRTRVFFDGVNQPMDFGIFIKKYLKQ
jgi:hypothetical protein